MTVEKEEKRLVPNVAFARFFKGTFLEEVNENFDIQRMEPHAVVEDGDTVVGEMAEVELRLWMLSAKYGKLAKLMEIKIEETPPGEERDLYMNETMQELVGKGKVACELAWVLVRDRLGLWGADVVGVRQGQLVVTSKGSRVASGMGSGMGSAVKKLAELLGGLPPLPLD